MGHYVENTGTTTVRFLEMFKSSYYADVSLAQWLALTPSELLHVHLNLDEQVTKALTKTKIPVRPA
ncbi:oxalate decarboxylase/phosphoglucose isomerase-like protein (cupin superfamily) [Bradyrhizobium sp. S3.14.4]